MKYFILGTLLFSTASFAQTLDLNGLKNLVTARKATFEKVNVGMTKKTITTAKEGECNYLLTATASVLKIESNRMIVLSKEKFQPQNSPACRAAGYTASFEESILFYDELPSATEFNSDLDLSSPDIKGITKAGDLVTLNMFLNNENVTMKYDLSKSLFKSLVLTQGATYKSDTQDVADIDVKTVNLTKVLFCDNNDGDNSECVEGDFSDILF